MKNIIFNNIKVVLLTAFLIFIFSGCSMIQNWFSPDQTNITSVQSDANDAKTQYRLARHFQKKGRHQLAVEEFKKLIKNNPENFNAYNALGVSYDRLRKFDLATNAYGTALKINPDLDYVYNNLGYSKLLQGDLNKAAKAFQKAIALNNKNKLYQNNLALVQAKMGKKTLIAESKPVVEPIIQKQITSNKTIPEKENCFYAIQIGVSYNINVARRIMNKAVIRGFSNTYITKVKHETPFYRVRFGKFENESDAKSMASRILDKHGKQALVVSEKYPLDIYYAQTAQKNHGMKNLNIEIANGNGIYRMARKIGNHLASNGFCVIRLTNADHFNYKKTIIYYNPGYYEHAVNLAQELPGFDPAGRLIQTQHITEKIKVVIGKDIVSLKS